MSSRHRYWQPIDWNWAPVNSSKQEFLNSNVGASKSLLLPSSFWACWAHLRNGINIIVVCCIDKRFVQQYIKCIIWLSWCWCLCKESPLEIDQVHNTDELQVSGHVFSTTMFLGRIWSITAAVHVFGIHWARNKVQLVQHSWCVSPPGYLA